MWAYHQRADWKDLDDLEEPTNGRRLDVGGFVLGDPFDEFLRNISEDYLRIAWEHLSRVLEQKRVVADDLSWGWMYPGETGFPDEGRLPDYRSAPGDYIGWTSCDLSEMWRSDQDRLLDEILRTSKPCLRCTATWRSLKWRIAPNDFALALRLVEAICVDEISDWHPDILPEGNVNPSELWRKFAKAIRDDDQSSLDLLLSQAKHEYSTLGFRILVRGYATYIHGGQYRGNVILPEVA